MRRSKLTERTARRGETAEGHRVLNTLSSWTGHGSDGAADSSRVGVGQLRDVAGADRVVGNDSSVTERASGSVGDREQRGRRDEDR